MSLRSVKTNPTLWEKAKREACRASKRLCPHSARKMQWAVRYYKRHGGKYSGPKNPKLNSLSKWTRQKWRTHSGKPSDGKRRYLPSKAWRALSPSQIRRTNDAKRRGKSQWVSQPKDVRRKVRKYRE